MSRGFFSESGSSFGSGHGFDIDFVYVECTFELGRAEQRVEPSQKNSNFCIILGFRFGVRAGLRPGKIAERSCSGPCVNTNSIGARLCSPTLKSPVRSKCDHLMQIVGLFLRNLPGTYQEPGRSLPGTFKIMQKQTNDVPNIAQKSTPKSAKKLPK